jgi:hypothetical protein
MRSSKSRSRNKTNRPRTLGNIVNRVFDSSGPEGKVRGTPQQIIEKYLFLARDAQLSNDRVAAENFLQHAEHYTRMLAEAQRELALEQEERQRQFGPNGQNGNGGYQNGDRRDGDEPRAERSDTRDGDRRDNDRRDGDRRDNDRRDGDRRDGDRRNGEQRDGDRRDNRNDGNRGEGGQGGNRNDRRDNWRDRRDGDRRDDRRDQQRAPAGLEVVEAVDDTGLFEPAPAPQPASQPAVQSARDDLPAFLNAPLDPAPPQAEAPAKKPRAPRKPKTESAETAE